MKRKQIKQMGSYRIYEMLLYRYKLFLTYTLRLEIEILLTEKSFVGLCNTINNWIKL